MSLLTCRGELWFHFILFYLYILTSVLLCLMFWVSLSNALISLTQILFDTFSYWPGEEYFIYSCSSLYIKKHLILKGWGGSFAFKAVFPVRRVTADTSRAKVSGWACQRRVDTMDDVWRSSLKEVSVILMSGELTQAHSLSASWSSSVVSSSEVEMSPQLLPQTKWKHNWGVSWKERRGYSLCGSSFSGSP